MRIVLFFFFVLSTGCLVAQQLFINEISQGPSGAKEYVEFIVAGPPSCANPAPCVDLRGIIFDDNNGTFASGSGTGIATGAMRFADIPFWSCVPQGTLIVIYNESDINVSVPPNDVSLTDGNCLLVVPTNSMLLEGQAIGPTSSSSAYPPASDWIAGGGAWAQVAMSNSNDSFYLRQSITNSTVLHAVSWGNNTNNNLVYFPAAGGNVFAMLNLIDNDPVDQINWSSLPATSSQTPGASNNAQNAQWIASMNTSCGITTPISVVTSGTASSSCGGACTGTASVSISGGSAPYTILWSNGDANASLSNLCPGTYSVTVTDAGGCTETAQAIVDGLGANLSVTLTPTSTSCAQACNGSIVSTVSGGTSPYSYLWNTGATTENISNLCVGTYEVGVIDASGCFGTAIVQVDAGTTVITSTILPTNESCDGLCDGELLLDNISGGAQPITFSWSNGASTNLITDLCPDDYVLTATDANGCMHWSTITIFPGATITPVSITTTGPFETTDPAVQFVATVAGGTWTSNCGSCISTGGSFNPSAVAAGTYEICVAVGSGACASTDCIDVVVNQGCVPQFTTSSLTICPEETITINGQLITASGTYSWDFIDVDGCDSTHTLTLAYFQTLDINQTLNACDGDSLFVDDQWYYASTQVSFLVLDQNGCEVTQNVSLVFSDCTIIPLEVFIPNTFTPNSDEVNDTFAISIVGGVLEQGFILNRWGSVVHEFKPDSLSWDGTTASGLAVQDGVYTYVVDVHGIDTPETKRFHGFVTVIR